MFNEKNKKTEGSRPKDGKSKNAVKKSKVKRIKPKTQRPVARTISLVMALLMLLVFVIPSCMSVWNMFFGAKLNHMDFNDEKTRKLLQELSEIAKKQQNSEGGFGEENGLNPNESGVEGEPGEGEEESGESVEAETEQEPESDESAEE